MSHIVLASSTCLYVVELYVKEDNSYVVDGLNFWGGDCLVFGQM